VLVRQGFQGHDKHRREQTKMKERDGWKSALRSDFWQSRPVRMKECVEVGFLAVPARMDEKVR